VLAFTKQTVAESLWIVTKTDCENEHRDSLFRNVFLLQLNNIRRQLRRQTDAYNAFISLIHNLLFIISVTQ